MSSTSHPNVVGATCIDNPEMLSQLVRRCIQQDTPLVDYGRDHDQLGHPPPIPHARLTQTGDILEHHERDMTVRAAAGITIGRLQAVLGARNQFFPIDADDDLTLGEVINHNVYGPLRVGYGAARDLILGLRYVDGEGHQIHVGGRTVKNVAGYDLSRFMVGSFGEMGIVYEATIRTYAIPQIVGATCFTIDDLSALDGQMTTWLKTDAAPTWLAASVQHGKARVNTGYFGRAKACGVQRAALHALVDGLDAASMDMSCDQDFAADIGWRHTWRQWRRSATLLCKLIVPPASTGTACQRLRAWTDDGNGRRLDAMPIHGCIFVGTDEADADVDSLDACVNDLVESLDALRQWHRRPPNAPTVPPFAPPQPDWPMLQRLKTAMDPHGLFNPGRMLETLRETS